MQQNPRSKGSSLIELAYLLSWIGIVWLVAQIEITKLGLQSLKKLETLRIPYDGENVCSP